MTDAQRGERCGKGFIQPEKECRVGETKSPAPKSGGDKPTPKPASPSKPSENFTYPLKISDRAKQGGYKSIVAEVEEQIRHLPHEVAVGIDKETGEVLFVTKGDEHSAPVPPNVLKRILASEGDFTITHNHPGGRTFSTADMIPIFSLGVEMRAVSADYTYSFTPPKEFKNNPDINEAIAIGEGASRERERIAQSQREEFRQKVLNKELKAKDAEEEWLHSSTQEMAKMTGSTYTRTSVKTQKQDSQDTGVDRQISAVIKSVVGKPINLKGYALTQKGEVFGVFSAANQPYRFLANPKTGTFSYVELSEKELKAIGESARQDAKDCDVGKACGDSCVSKGYECETTLSGKAAHVLRVAAPLIKPSKTKIIAAISGLVAIKLAHGTVQKYKQLTKEESDFEIKISDKAKKAGTRAVLAEVEDQIKGLPHEVAVAIDEDSGEVLFSRKGSKDSVAMSVHDIRKLVKTPRVVFTHNHPDQGDPDGITKVDGGPFSAGDINSFFASNLKEMRAVSPGATYIMKSSEERTRKAQTGEIDRASALAATGRYEEIEKSLALKYAHEFRLGKHKTVAEAGWALCGETNRQLAKEYGYTYQRIAHSPRKDAKDPTVRQAIASNSRLSSVTRQIQAIAKSVYQKPMQIHGYDLDASGKLVGVFSGGGEMYSFSADPKTGSFEYVEANIPKRRADAYMMGWTIDGGFLRYQKEDAKCTIGKSCGGTCIERGRKCRIQLSTAARTQLKATTASLQELKSGGAKFPGGAIMKAAIIGAVGGSAGVAAVRSLLPQPLAAQVAPAALSISSADKTPFYADKLFRKKLLKYGLPVASGLVVAGAALQVKKDLDDSMVDFDSIRQPPGGIPDEETLRYYDTLTPGDLIRKNFKAPGFGTRAHYGIYAGKDPKTGEHTIIEIGQDVKTRDSLPTVLQNSMTSGPSNGGPNETQYEKVPPEDMQRDKGARAIPQEEVLKRAQKMLGRRLTYEAFDSNCETFARAIAEGKSYSIQSQNLTALTRYVAKQAFNLGMVVRIADKNKTLASARILDLGFVQIEGISDYYSAKIRKQRKTSSEIAEELSGAYAQDFEKALGGGAGETSIFSLAMTPRRQKSDTEANLQIPNILERKGLRDPAEFIGMVEVFTSQFPGMGREVNEAMLKAYIMLLLASPIKGRVDSLRLDKKCGKSFIPDSHKCRAGSIGEAAAKAAIVGAVGIGAGVAIASLSKEQRNGSTGASPVLPNIPAPATATGQPARFNKKKLMKAALAAGTVGVAGAALYLGAKQLDEKYQARDLATTWATQHGLNALNSEQTTKLLESVPMSPEMRKSAKNLVGHTKVLLSRVQQSGMGSELLAVDPKTNSFTYKMRDGSFHSITSVGQHIMTFNTTPDGTTKPPRNVYQMSFQVNGQFDRDENVDRRNGFTLFRRAEKFFNEHTQLVPDGSAVVGTAYDKDGEGEYRGSIYEDRGFTRAGQSESLWAIKKNGKLIPATPSAAAEMQGNWEKAEIQDNPIASYRKSAAIYEEESLREMEQDLAQKVPEGESLSSILQNALFELGNLPDRNTAPTSRRIITNGRSPRSGGIRLRRPSRRDSVSQANEASMNQQQIYQQEFNRILREDAIKCGGGYIPEGKKCRKGTGGQAQSPAAGGARKGGGRKAAGAVAGAGAIAAAAALAMAARKKQAGQVKVAAPNLQRFKPGATQPGKPQPTPEALERRKKLIKAAKVAAVAGGAAAIAAGAGAARKKTPNQRLARAAAIAAKAGNNPNKKGAATPQQAAAMRKATAKRQLEIAQEESGAKDRAIARAAAMAKNAGKDPSKEGAATPQQAAAMKRATARKIAQEKAKRKNKSDSARMDKKCGGSAIPDNRTCRKGAGASTQAEAPKAGGGRKGGRFLKGAVKAAAIAGTAVAAGAVMQSAANNTVRKYEERTAKVSALAPSRKVSTQSGSKKKLTMEQKRKRRMTAIKAGAAASAVGAVAATGLVARAAAKEAVRRNLAKQGVDYDQIQREGAELRRKLKEQKKAQKTKKDAIAKI